MTELNPLPSDTSVADHWAQLRLLLSRTGHRVNVHDTWIAATALAHDVAVVTQDSGFDPLAALSQLRVIHV